MAGNIDLGKNYERLPDVLEHYEKEYAQYDSHIKTLKGKTIEQVLIENISWYAFFSEKQAELKKILAYMEARVTQTKGQIYKGTKKGSQVTMVDRELMRYVEADEAYIEVHVLMLEVKELHDMYEQAVKSCSNINYAMNNIVKARVASIEDVTL